MEWFNVAVTHTSVHRFRVRAANDAQARAFAVETIKNHGLSDDVTIPEHVVETYERVVERYDASTDPDEAIRAVRERAKHGTDTMRGLGELQRESQLEQSERRAVIEDAGVPDVSDLCDVSEHEAAQHIPTCDPCWQAYDRARRDQRREFHRRTLAGQLWRCLRGRTR